MTPCTPKTLAEAIAQAAAWGLTDVRQIKQAVRRRGIWFLTWGVQA